MSDASYEIYVLYTLRSVADPGGGKAAKGALEWEFGGGCKAVHFGAILFHFNAVFSSGSKGVRVGHFLPPPPRPGPVKISHKKDSREKQ